MGSACCVYAIVGRDTLLPAAGIGGDAELAMVPCGALAAVTGRMDAGAVRVTTEAVLHHEAIVEAVRRQGPALPVRFGTVFRDATSVASALAQRYEPLAADLHRLGDKVEMGLTAMWGESPSREPTAGATTGERTPAAPGAGARYLYARAAAARHDAALKENARAVARELDLVLGALALERRESLLPTPRVAVRTAYLLDPAGVGAFRAAFDEVRGNRDDLRLLLTGPWPPYSFVRRTDTDDGAAPGDRLVALARLLTDAMAVRPD